MESMAANFLVECIRVLRGSKYLLVIADKLTKLCKTVPVNRISAARVAKHFVNECRFDYGPPRDHTPKTVNASPPKFFQSVCKRRNFQNLFTTLLSPPSQRVGKTIQPHNKDDERKLPRGSSVRLGPVHYSAYICIYLSILQDSRPSTAGVVRATATIRYETISGISASIQGDKA